MDVDQDEPAQLSQQPLALAFYVSTARTGPLPRWFWAHCPHLEIQCPVFLKVCFQKIKNYNFFNNLLFFVFKRI